MTRRAPAAALAVLALGAGPARAQDTTTPPATTVPAVTTPPDDSVEIPVPDAGTTPTAPSRATAPARRRAPAHPAPLVVTPPAPAAAPVPAAPLPRTGGEPWLVALEGLSLALCGAGLRLRTRTSWADPHRDPGERRNFPS